MKDNPQFQMTLQSELAAAGWHLSQRGLEICTEGLTDPVVKDVIKKV